MGGEGVSMGVSMACGMSDGYLTLGVRFSGVHVHVFGWVGRRMGGRVVYLYL
jgi:hypothetical protein